MTILVTGSNGKTAAYVAPMVAETHPVLVTSRKGVTERSVFPTARFEWFDSSTYSLPFEHPLAKRSPITAAYIVAPLIAEPSEVVIAFIKFSIQRGVKRFVLLSQVDQDENHPAAFGLVHKFLKESEVEWTVVRATFFMDNFAETWHLETIKNEDKIYTGAGQGRLAFIAAEDIASVAHRALTDLKPHNRDYELLGSEAIDHDTVATHLSEVLGRKIEHVNLNPDELFKFLSERSGFGVDLVKEVVELDAMVSRGELSATNEVVKMAVGRPAMTMKEFFQKNKSVYA